MSLPSIYLRRNNQKYLLSNGIAKSWMKPFVFSLSEGFGK